MFDEIGLYNSYLGEIVFTKSVDWLEKVPLGNPVCHGIDPETGLNRSHRCEIPVPSPSSRLNTKYMTLMILFITIACIVVLLLVVLTSLYLHKKKLENSYFRYQKWKIPWADIEFDNEAINNVSTLTFNSNRLDPLYYGAYQNNLVFIKKVPMSDRLNINKKLLNEIKLIKDINHENLTNFVGISYDRTDFAVITNLVSRLNLIELLAKETLELDLILQYSIINDIIKGMVYLHASPIGYHGRLTSAQILIDNRFSAKIAGFGLPTFYEEYLRNELKKGDISKYLVRYLPWTAPEHLRRIMPVINSMNDNRTALRHPREQLRRSRHLSHHGSHTHDPLYTDIHGRPITLSAITKEADVYSFAMILSEIATRKPPFFNNYLVHHKKRGNTVPTEKPFDVFLVTLRSSTMDIFTNYTWKNNAYVKYLKQVVMEKVRNIRRPPFRPMLEVHQGSSFMIQPDLTNIGSGETPTNLSTRSLKIEVPAFGAGVNEEGEENDQEIEEAMGKRKKSDMYANYLAKYRQMSAIPEISCENVLNPKYNEIHDSKAVSADSMEAVLRKRKTSINVANLLEGREIPGKDATDLSKPSGAAFRMKVPQIEATADKSADGLGTLFDTNPGPSNVNKAIPTATQSNPSLYNDKRKIPITSKRNTVFPQCRINNKKIRVLIEMCWDENPSNRPSFTSVTEIFKCLTKRINFSNMIDSLLERLEEYTVTLEEMVGQKTKDVAAEKERVDQYLFEILPKPIAIDLKRGIRILPEEFRNVTVYFSDIVNFTNLSATSTPIEIVDFLNELYCCFDTIVERFDAYKVETIGDAYMVVSGLPKRNGNRHIREIARFSLAIRESISHFQIRHRPDDKLEIRIGIHTGPCAAGIVGLKMPRYCLFGDTIIVASQMESKGEAMKIHLSQNSKEALDDFPSFVVEERGPIKLQGKGKVITYWLLGEE